MCNIYLILYKDSIYILCSSSLVEISSLYFNYLMYVEARKSYVKVPQQLDEIFTICVWVSL